MNAHEFEAVVRAWLRQSYRVIPVFVYHREGNEWKIPAHTEFFRGYRVFPQGDEWMEKCSRSFAHYLYTLLRDQSLVDYGG